MAGRKIFLVLVLAGTCFGQRPDPVDLESRVRLYNDDVSNGRTDVLEARSVALVELMRVDPERALSAALPPASTGTLERNRRSTSPLLETWGRFSGEVQVAIADDPEHPERGVEYRMKTADGDLEMHFTNPPKDLRCGTILEAEGIRAGEVAAARIVSEVRAALSCSPLGEQRIAVLLLHFSSGQLPANITQNYIRNIYFGATSSVTHYWNEVSYGKTTASGDVFGPFTLPATYSCSQYNQLRSDAIAAADSTVNFTQYTQIVLILPLAYPCSGGLGTIGCNTLNSGDGLFAAGTVWIRADFFATPGLGLCGAVHEGGHNMGLYHSGTEAFSQMALGPPGSQGTRSEYGDTFSVMGGGGACRDNLTGHYTAQQKAQLGWFSGTNTQTVQSAGTFPIAPLETSTSSLQALRIRRGQSGNRWLWLEYRQPIGYDATFPLFAGSSVYSGGLIHNEDPSTNTGDTWLLDFTPATPNDFSDAALPSGASWTDPYSLLRLSVNSANSSALNVTVDYDMPCGVLSPGSAFPPSGSSTGSVVINASPACTWVAVSDSPWLTIVSGAGGSGSGTITYSVAANPNTASRTGVLTIQRQSFLVTQAGTAQIQVPNVVGLTRSAAVVAISSAGLVLGTVSTALNPAVPAGNVISSSPSAGTAVSAGAVVSLVISGAVPISVSPASGNSGRRTFSFVARHPLTANNIQYVQFLFTKSGVSALNACYVSYDPTGNVFYLLSDDMTQWYGLLAGSSATVGNAQCTVHGATSTGSRSGTDVLTTLDVSFRTGFGGAKSIYQFSGDTTGSSGWQLMGTWNDSGDLNVVELISLSPSAGTGASQTFTATVRDGNGGTTIPFVQFVINSSLSGANGCYIHYDRASNVFFLLNDTGTQFAGLPAGSGQVSNSQCTLMGSGSGGTASGNDLTVSYNLVFAPSFSGLKRAYMQVADNTGVIEAWRQMGTWTR